MATGRCKVSIYIGPSLPGLQTRTIFDAPAHAAVKKPEVRLVSEKYPSVTKLIVNGTALDRSVRDMTTPGTAIYKAVQELKRR